MQHAPFSSYEQSFVKRAMGLITHTKVEIVDNDIIVDGVVNIYKCYLSHNYVVVLDEGMGKSFTLLHDALSYIGGILVADSINNMYQADCMYNEYVDTLADKNDWERQFD